MKIATIITGHLRGGLLNFRHAYYNFFSRYDTDIYISTWDRQESDHKVAEKHLLPWKETGKLINFKIHNAEEYDRNKKLYTLDYDRSHNIEDICKLSKQQIFSRFMDQSQEKARQTHCGFAHEAVEYWANRIKDQYYMVKKSFDLVQDYRKYDLIVRTRFDYLFLNPLRLQILEDRLSVASNNSGDMHYDCIQYGQPEVMKKYFLLYDHIDEFVGNLNYLNRFSYERFNAENMMKHYMEEHGDQKYKLHMDPNLKEQTNFILQRG